MQKFGNILAILDYHDSQISQIESVLESQDIAYERVENTFFLQTESKPQTYKTIEKLRETGLKFIHFLNNRASGSALITSGLDDDVTQRLKKMIFDNRQ